jgi:hypothetical protein
MNISFLIFYITFLFFVSANPTTLDLSRPVGYMMQAGQQVNPIIQQVNPLAQQVNPLAQQVNPLAQNLNPMVQAQQVVQQVAQQAPQIASSTTSTIAKVLDVVAGPCTRTKCYTVAANTIEETVKNAIVSETNNEINYLNNLIDVRFSSYTGPILAVSFVSPTIIEKIQNGDNIGAIGTTMNALVKYKVGVFAFGSCTAYTTPFLGPFSIIPGIGCSVASSFIADNTYNSIKNTFYPVSNHRNRHYDDY